ncbi:MAG: hypothetical protein AB7O98_19160 [Hyphomonadaceae bacterium]
MSTTSDDHHPWTEEKQQPMLVMQHQGSMASAVTRALMNLAVLFFMLVVVGLAVASFFIRQQYEAQYEAELRLTSQSAAEIVTYAEQLDCAREAMAQRDYEVVSLPEVGGLEPEPMPACDYTALMPPRPAPRPNDRAGAPTRIVLPLPPDRPSLQVRIDALVAENEALRRPPRPPGGGTGGGGGLMPEN